MTVYSIDKRVVPETNMTSAVDNRQQAAASSEDAFSALVQRATQSFTNRMTGLPSVATALAPVLSRPVAQPQDNPAPAAARDDTPAPRAPASRDARATGRSDRPQAKQADNAPVTQQANDSGNDNQAQAASSDNQASASDKDQTGSRQSGNGDAGKAHADAGGHAHEAQPQPDGTVIVSMLQVAQVAVQTVTTQVAAQVAVGNGAADQGTANGQQQAQAANDGAQQIQANAAAGQSDDADDSGMDFSALLQNAATSSAAKPKAASQAQGMQADAAQAQADDLASRLADTGANLSIKVTVNAAATTAPQTASAAVAAALVDAANQDASQQSQQATQAISGESSQPVAADPTAAAPVQQTAADALAAAQAQQVADDAKPFTAVMAAQMEASQAQQATTETEPQPMAGMTAVGSTQATDKATPGQAAQAPRAPRAVLQQQVMDQVQVQIDKQVKDGADTVKIQLKPLDLGKIEIKLEVAANGSVTATITADKPETLAMLQSDAKGLEKALGDAGLKPDSAAMSFNLRGDQQQNANNQGGNNTRPGRGRNRGLGNDANVSGVAQATQQSRGFGGRSGVDISV
jgi:hypothetical protein